MAAPLREIRILRLTAKLLLLASPPMIVTGFLTAKPYLLAELGFETSRLLHTKVVPLAFIPLLVIHSTAGILFLLSRNKKLNKPWVKLASSAAWCSVIALLSMLYFAGSPPAVPDDRPVPEDDRPLADAGASSPVRDGAPEDAQPGAAEAPEAGQLDAASSGEAASDGDRASGGAVDAALPPREKVPARQPPRPSQAPAKTRAPSLPAAQQGASDSGVAARRGDAGESQEPAATKLSGAQLVRERCGACHGVDKVYATRRTAAEWREVLARMIAMGVQLEAGERGSVLSHLISRVGRSGED